MIENPRSGERGVAFDGEPPQELAIDPLWIEDQKDENVADLLRVVLGVPYHRLEDELGATRRNLAHQLHSLRRLGEMIDEAGWENYDAFLLLRPDLKYLDRLRPAIDLGGVLNDRVDLVTPRWQPWGGLNDRFCFANRAGAKTYLERGRYAAEFAAQNGFIHSERLLRHAADAAGLRVGHTNLRASRVRADGRMHHERFGPNIREAVRAKLRPWRQRLALIGL